MTKKEEVESIVYDQHISRIRVTYVVYTTPKAFHNHHPNVQ